MLHQLENVQEFKKMKRYQRKRFSNSLKFQSGGIVQPGYILSHSLPDFLFPCRKMFYLFYVLNGIYLHDSTALK